MHIFPEHFTFSRDHQTWSGPRARSFTRREDAFQQLVGDLLREEAGLQVTVAPTEGRDGGIDAYLACDAPHELFLAPLGGPIVIECKDNDDARANVATNVLREWQKVQAKLERQAEGGWQDLYAPWSQARSYVFVTSAALSSAAARERLKAAIEAFFAELRRRGRSLVERAVVVDWFDLRSILGRHLRIADLWLGATLGSLVPHPQRLAQIKGFERYLVDIPFVEPPSSDPAHPVALLRRTLERANVDGALLLVGAGGAGKTRRLFEVARLADLAGWRVLHHGDAPARADEIAAEVFMGRTNTLVLCDYVDRLQLDIASIRSRLLPEAARRDMRVAFLGVARSSHAVRGDPKHEHFFEVIELRTGADYATRVRTALRNRLAPRAVEILGSESVDAQTGDRPIIAAFILLELERLAVENRLREVVARGVRSGDLVGWLRRRLHEDGLRALPPARPIDLEEIDPLLVATAAVMCSIPAAETEVREIAQGALSRCVVGSDRAPLEHRTRDLVAKLRAFGWLEEDDGELAAPHDAVADEIIGRVLRDPHDQVRAHLLNVLLEPSFGSAALLVRTVVALDRLLSADGQFERELKVQVTRSMKGAAQLIGVALAGATSDDAAQAFIVLSAGDPWRTVTLRHWDEIVVPWLNRHGAAEASSFALWLLLGRNDLRRPAAEQAIRAAMCWVAVHVDIDAASLVLAVLLDRPELTPQDQEDVTKAVLRWRVSNPESTVVGTLLGALLKCPGLPPETTALVVRELTAWCHKHGGTEQAAFALGALLDYRVLDRALAARVLAWAVDWVNRYGLMITAVFVLPSMLHSDDIDEALRASLVRAGLAWCRDNGTILHAPLLYAALLRRLFASDDEIEALDHAWRWFEVWQSRVEGVHGMLVLLRHANLMPERVQALARSGMAWIRAFGDHPAVPVVLTGLLRRRDLDAMTATDVEELALRWLEHGAHAEDVLVVTVLLERSAQPQDRYAPLVQRAIVWARIHDEHERFGEVAGTVLARAGLDTAGLVDIAEKGLIWVKQRGALEVAQIVGATVGRADLTPEIREQALDNAVRWARANPLLREAFIVLQHLLGRTDMRSELAREMRRVGLLWLDKHGHQPEAVFVLQHLVGSTVPDASIARRARLLSLRWLGSHGSSVDAIYLYQHLLQQRQRKDATRILEVSVQVWLEAHATRLEAVHVLICLLLRRGPKASSGDFAIALSWLAVHGLAAVAGAVLEALIRREDLDDLTLATVLAQACAWIRVHGLERHASGLLLAALRDQRIPDDDLRDFVARAFAWLDVNGDEPEASLVIFDGLCKVRGGVDRTQHLEFAVARWFAAAHEDVSQHPLFAWFFSTEQIGDSDDNATELVEAIEAHVVEHMDGESAALLGASVLPALLPLASRAGRPELQASAIERAVQRLGDERVPADLRDQIAERAYRLLDAGAWRTKRGGEQVLARLGLRRAGPRSRKDKGRTERRRS
ncbi:Hypothetical protein A7982_00488 [Minicystis rosea]|nr:Hypothetical protein A7982_00488 [Minicystis rosea]